MTFGEDPDGNPGPFVTVVGDFEHSASKFSWDGESYFSFIEPELGATVSVPAVEPDHPTLAKCHGVAMPHLSEVTTRSGSPAAP